MSPYGVLLLGVDGNVSRFKSHITIRIIYCLKRDKVKMSILKLLDIAIKITNIPNPKFWSSE